MRSDGSCSFSEMGSVKALLTVQLINLQLELIKNVTGRDCMATVMLDDQTKTKFTNYTTKMTAHIKI